MSKFKLSFGSCPCRNCSELRDLSFDCGCEAAGPEPGPECRTCPNRNKCEEMYGVSELRYEMLL